MKAAPGVPLGRATACLTLTACCIADADAHAFGARYDLPLPLWLYLAGAGAAVVLSFVVMAFSLREPAGDRRLRMDLAATRLGRLLGGGTVKTALRSISVALFCLILATGFLGIEVTTRNFAPVFVWIIWWVGMAFVQALCGDLWSVVNPWTALFDWSLALVRRNRRPVIAAGRWRYPASLGCAPAVALFLGFAWLELVSSAGEQPRTLAWCILAYSLLTWAGMWAFGRDLWLRNGEAFTVVFGLLARFGPSGPRPDADVPCWELRPYAVGLLCTAPVSAPLMVFVLCMLATVSFDGFLETPLWAGLLDWLVTDPGVRPFLLWLRGHGMDLLILVKTVGLLAAPLLFFVVYLAFSALMAGAAATDISTATTARYFVLTLVPIAVAYHLAHYLSYLLLAGQLVIPRISDPFGFGWNLFGTLNYVVDISVVNAKFVWYTAVTAIVAGHILAVYLAHRMAFRVFGARRAAIRSQYPMLVLMVAYTMLSLWILSQPVVEA